MLFCVTEGTDEDIAWISRVLLHSLSVSLLFCISVLNYGMLCVCVCVCHCVYGQVKYKFKAKDLLKSGCNEILRPDILTALYQSTMGSKVNNQRLNHGNSDPCPQTGRKQPLCNLRVTVESSAEVQMKFS